MNLPFSMITNRLKYELVLICILLFCSLSFRYSKDLPIRNGIGQRGPTAEVIKPGDCCGERSGQIFFGQLENPARKIARNSAGIEVFKGAIIRGETTKKEIALVFTGDEFGDGDKIIPGVLKKQGIRASFFLTGNFYRNPSFRNLIKILRKQGNYLGPHSDRHLLYCDWDKRDSLLVTKSQFKDDLDKNLEAIKKHGVPAKSIQYFLPPYEWYNDSISAWTKEMGMQLINYSPGTLSAADYTYPGVKNYRGTNEIFRSIIDKEAVDKNGLNGFILLLHIGTDPKRTDKFYYRLNELIEQLKQKGYRFNTVSDLLQ